MGSASTTLKRTPPRLQPGETLRHPAGTHHLRYAQVRMTPSRQRRVGADLRRVHPAQLGQVAVLQPREGAVLLHDRGAERRGRQEVVEDRGFDLGVEEEARVPDV